MNVNHHSLEDRFHRVRWVPNTFPPCNIAFELRLRVLQWNRQLFNYWKNKKTIIEKFLISLI